MPSATSLSSGISNQPSGSPVVATDDRSTIEKILDTAGGAIDGYRDSTRTDTTPTPGIYGNPNRQRDWDFTPRGRGGAGGGLNFQGQQRQQRQQQESGGVSMATVLIATTVVIGGGAIAMKKMG